MAQPSAGQSKSKLSTRLTHWGLPTSDVAHTVGLALDHQRERSVQDTARRGRHRHPELIVRVLRLRPFQFPHTCAGPDAESLGSPTTRGQVRLRRNACRSPRSQPRFHRCSRGEPRQALPEGPKGRQLPDRLLRHRSGGCRFGARACGSRDRTISSLFRFSSWTIRKSFPAP